MLVVLGWMTSLSVAFSSQEDSTQGSEGSWKFAVFGDHRGDNKAFQTVTRPGGERVIVGYTDGGINKPALASLAAALKEEGVAFVLDVGDLVTKWQPAITGKDANTLVSEQLADWHAIWLENAGRLPLFPVRGNQEWSAPLSTWTDWLQTVPGIGQANRMHFPANDAGLSYAFRHKNCLFVAVDEYASAISSDSPTIDAPTMSWLSDLLRCGDRPHVFVYGHAPAYEVWDSKKASLHADEGRLAFARAH